MKTPALAFAVALIAMIQPLLSAALGQDGNSTTRTKPTVVIVPTLGNDHQFNLDYSVAHLKALLDTIGPDAIIVNDFTDWLRHDCPKNTFLPEIHVALDFAHERSIPIFGAFSTPAPTFEGTEKWAEGVAKGLSDARTIESGYRKRLDTTTARIAREYSFSEESRDLHVLITRVFPSQRKEWSERQKATITSQSAPTASEIKRLVLTHSKHRCWAILVPWTYSLAIEEAVRDREAITSRTVADYLPLSTAAIDRRMDARYSAWILAGTLDEWFGMWAPQVFPGERLYVLLQRLKGLAPDESSTAFFEARWRMQNRDYAEAERILARLVDTAGEGKFSFPINGKWLRPPWSSVHDKAKLNLAFVYDYRGERDKALQIYRQLLQKGDKLNEEARSEGFLYDDIRAVIQSYVEKPYTGMPEEAFRHFPITVGKPKCLDGDE